MYLTCGWIDNDYFVAVVLLSIEWRRF